MPERTVPLSYSRGMKANFYKCGNRTVHKHFIAWAPIESAAPNFHQPQYFRSIAFE
ncbi:MAG TPA: hypothetical protein DEG55_03775 [Acidaminococcaceae bacterium]|nr:hypothetical protein [Acidaminococcaceae bacterium]